MCVHKLGMREFRRDDDVRWQSLYGIFWNLSKAYIVWMVLFVAGKLEIRGDVAKREGWAGLRNSSQMLQLFSTQGGATFKSRCGGTLGAWSVPRISKPTWMVLPR